MIFDQNFFHHNVKILDLENVLNYAQRLLYKPSFIQNTTQLQNNNTRQRKQSHSCSLIHGDSYSLINNNDENKFTKNKNKKTMTMAKNMYPS